MSLRIVYIDDEVDLCKIFYQIFSRKGFEVIVFSNPTEGMEYITANPPDIIFFDYRLSGKNGDELALILSNKIPKYLITGELNVKTKYPFEKIFNKPFNPNEVLAELTRHLK
jgi:DNA-binding response OmpR family regulator